MTERDQEWLVEIERRMKEQERLSSERDRRLRLFDVYERALMLIADGHEKPIELAVRTLMGG